MTTRKQRIIQWVWALCIASLLWNEGAVVKNLLNKPEKQSLTVYAPLDMEDAFVEALNLSSLKESHKIVMTDNPNANICVEYAKQDDSTYQKFAYSPFVVAYNEEDDYLEELEKSEVCVECKYDDDYHEIDFLKIIEEAIGEGKWSNLGIEKQGELKVFYPDEESIYWNDFYDFMLVTVNDGKYPKNEAEFLAAEKTINKFIDSEYTKGVTDFYEQVSRTGGFPPNAIYTLPEKDVKYICSNQYEYARLLFPLNTVYFNYYVKGDELGNQIIDSFDETSFWNDFYKALKRNYYRVSKYDGVFETEYLYDERDIYDVVKIPKNKEFKTSQQTE